MKYALLVAIPYVFVMTLAALGGMEHIPIDSTQVGFRGTGMVQVDNPRTEADLAKKNQPPESIGTAEPGGDLAKDVYENVKVLGDLTEDEFNLYMAAITEWVAPEEGCNYCHNPENLADDNIYTKVVARRMMQMTQTINADWSDHVKDTGVNCYTCHRGQHVPAYAWANDDQHPEANKGFAQTRNNQNYGTEVTAYSSLPYDALTDLLTKDDAAIRVQSRLALPTKAGSGPIQDTEKSYSLMMHMSQGLGVNCTYCHNSRAFYKWDESSPRRVQAYHGIEMAQSINEVYLDPLASALPEHRLGPLGDAPKANCATCHQGIPKPMYGAPMTTDHPRALTGK